MIIIAQKLDNRQHIILRLVERVEDLILGDGDRCRAVAADASLHLDEARPARAWHAALDVVARLLEFPVNRLKTQTALNFHAGCMAGL